MAAAPEPVSVEMRGPNPWLALLIIGGLTAALGIWLMLSRNGSKSFIVVLFGIGLFLNALSELVWASGRAKPWVGYLLGALFAIGGIVVLTQPDAGKRVIALVVGITLIAIGVFQAASALLEREEMRHWGWALAFGIFTLAIGIAAIVWPDAAVRVIAFLFGIRLLIIGLGLMGLGNEFRKLRPT